MYISNNNSVNVRFAFGTIKAAEVALLDSGATDNFIDRKTVDRLNIPIHPLARPHILYNVD
jgi:hypothetical protein